MGVIWGLAAAAAGAYKLYRWLKNRDDGDEVITNIKSQAATISAFAKAVFDVFSALSTARLPGITAAAAVPTNGLFRDPLGYPAGGLSIGNSAASSVGR